MRIKETIVVIALGRQSKAVARIGVSAWWSVMSLNAPGGQGGMPGTRLATEGEMISGLDGLTCVQRQDKFHNDMTATM